MIFVLHGDNQPAKRNELIEIKKKYPQSKWWEGDEENLVAELPTYLSSPSFFGSELVILENPPLDKVSKVLKNWKNPVKDLAIMFDRPLKAAELKKFSEAQILIFRETVPQNVFPLLDAVAARNRVKALIEYRRLKKNSHGGDELINMLAWQLRSLTRVKDGATKSISPFVAGKLSRVSKNWEHADLKKALSSVLRQDLASKRGKKVPFDFLISKITGSER